MFLLLLCFIRDLHNTSLLSLKLQIRSTVQSLALQPDLDRSTSLASKVRNLLSASITIGQALPQVNMTYHGVRSDILGSLLALFLNRLPTVNRKCEISHVLSTQFCSLRPRHPNKSNWLFKITYSNIVRMQVKRVSW